MLEDLKINVKFKLSALWVALMFLYLYNDVFGSFRQDQVEKVLSGEIGLNQVSLFGAAILMAIPIFMIFLSLSLPAKVNRRVNIIVGIAYAVVLVLVMLVPETWAYYLFYEILEAVFIALIVWHAWKWPKQEG
jgi:CBS domain containing-hemolysin-like protein